MRRRLLLGAGTIAAGAGLVAAATGAAGPLVAVDRWMVGLLGLATLVWGVSVASTRRGRSVEGAEPGEPERLRPVPAPGDDLADDLGRIGLLRASGPRDRVRERLRSAATALVARREDCSHRRARELVLAGEWTDDPFAASFLAGQDGPRDPPLPPRIRLRVASAFRYRARRTIGAIADLADVASEAEVDR